MKKAKSAKKKVGRPTGRKPLLNLRVPQSLHEQIKSSAESAGRTVAEEAAHRLEFSFRAEARIAEMMRARGGKRMFGRPVREPKK